MDSATYRHLVGQIKKSCSIPHYKIPCHNLLSLETLLKVSPDTNDELEGETQFLCNFPCYKPFEWSVQMNTPLFCGSGMVDDANDLVKKKLAWEKKLKSIKVANVQKAVKCIKNLRDNQPTKVSKNLVKYIEHFQQDPEPSFHGSYNWLYTGGNLVVVQGQDWNGLIAPDCMESRPGFNLLKLSDTLDEVLCKTSCPLKAYSPVLQICCQRNKEDFLVCVRQKNYISLFGVHDSYVMTPVGLWRKKVLDSKLLTSMDLKGDCKEVVTTDSKQDVNVFDVETKRKIYGHSGRREIDLFHQRDAWSQAVFGDCGVYLALRNSVSVLDFRDFNSGKLLYDPSTATNNCEDICSLEKCSDDSNYIYLGTSHNFLQVDLRNKRAVQRWTHMMKSPPQFVKALNEDENDFIVLQSQLVDETLGITNECIRDGDGINFLSRSLPCLIDSIKTSLKTARFHSVCLNPFVSKRFGFCVTGVQCLKGKEGVINLYTCNSGGDIFLRQLKRIVDHSATDYDEKILNSMKMYESHFEKVALEVPPKTSLELVNMKPVLKMLKDPSLKLKINKAGKMDWKYHEMFAPESLSCYKDFLAEKVLDVWGFKPEDSEPENETISADAKVREWMEKM